MKELPKHRGHLGSLGVLLDRCDDSLPVWSPAVTIDAALHGTAGEAEITDVLARPLVFGTPLSTPSQVLFFGLEC